MKRYKIGNAPRPKVGDTVLVPFESKLHQAEVVDVTRDDVLVRVGAYVRPLRVRAKGRYSELESK